MSPYGNRNESLETAWVYTKTNVTLVEMKIAVAKYASENLLLR